MERIGDKIYCGKLQVLRPVLKEWIALIRKSSREWGRNDCSWWYSERVNLGVFAGAIWRRGGSCFEEYTEERYSREGKYRGRGDLYFKYSNINFVAEAKQFWPNAGSKSEKLEETIREAIKLDHFKTDHVEAGNARRLELVYVIPRMPKSDLNKIDACIRNLIDIVNDLPVKCIAYTFPVEKRRLRDKDGDGYIYPGVILLIK
jgi:hypothetical protein